MEVTSDVGLMKSLVRSFSPSYSSARVSRMKKLVRQAENMKQNAYLCFDFWELLMRKAMGRKQLIMLSETNIPYSTRIAEKHSTIRTCSILVVGPSIVFSSMKWTTAIVYCFLSCRSQTIWLLLWMRACSCILLNLDQKNMRQLSRLTIKNHWNKSDDGSAVLSTFCISRASPTSTIEYCCRCFFSNTYVFRW